MSTEMDSQISSHGDAQQPPGAEQSEAAQPAQTVQTMQTAPTPPAAQPAQPTQPAEAPGRRVPDGRLIAALALIAFGVLALLATFTKSDVFGLSILPGLGVLFIVWALVVRQPGLMIPGGIMTGLGLGILLATVAFDSAPGETRGGIIVLGLGLGFLMIMPLILLISSEKHWWALIPGGILVVVGLALLIGGGALDALAVVGQFWPIVPIVVGIILIWQLLRRRQA